MIDTPEPTSTTRDHDGSLIAGVRALIEDGRTLAQAELEFQKARATYVAQRGKGIAVLLVLALFFAFFALMALVVGLLLSLAPLLTPWGATAVMVLVLGGLAALCGLKAIKGFRAAKARLSEKEPGA